MLFFFTFGITPRVFHLVFAAAAAAAVAAIGAVRVVFLFEVVFELLDSIEDEKGGDLEFSNCSLLFFFLFFWSDGIEKYDLGRQ